MKKLLLLFLLLPTLVWAGSPSRVFTYTSGAIIDPSKVTSNEDAIFNYLTRGVSVYEDSTITTDDILNGTVANIDISGSAAIAYSKLNLTGLIVNADIIASAGIPYSKLTLTDSILNADINSSAGIVDTKLATITTASKVNVSAITGTLPVGNGGTGATAAANAANGVVVLGADGYLPNASCDTTALKTTTGEVSGTGNNYSVTLPGGEYGFYPQIKSASSNGWVSIHSVGGTDTAWPTSYTTVVSFYASGTGANVGYIQQRYVTASGTDHWLFLLLDKVTKEIICAYSAPDHPAYGNGGDFDKMPHPFGSYDETKHEIVLVDQETIAELKTQVTKEKSLLTLVNELYKPDMAKEEVYKPLHSGKYLTEDNKQVKELVKTIPDYIKVRKLIIK